MTRYIFTATAGRSGQNYWANLLSRHVKGCLALFEEPQVRTLLPAALGDFERRVRRRFFETHELLGRGRVLAAFDAGDDDALAHMAAKRLAWIDRQIRRSDADIYIDVSKYFIRGLHRSIVRLRPGCALVRLVRDPVRNMRSFVNRNKDFYLDNNCPNGRFNQLRLDPASLEIGELYLWSWCEVYLRAQALADEFDLELVEIRTEELTDAAAMARHFDALGLTYEPLRPGGPMNDNQALGFGPTRISQEDICLFQRFCDRLPAEILTRISYLHGYEAGRIHLGEPHQVTA